jgi:hypothetical protein
VRATSFACRARKVAAVLPSPPPGVVGIPSDVCLMPIGTGRHHRVSKADCSTRLPRLVPEWCRPSRLPPRHRHSLPASRRFCRSTSLQGAAADRFKHRPPSSGDAVVPVPLALLAVKRASISLGEFDDECLSSRSGGDLADTAGLTNCSAGRTRPGYAPANDPPDR